MGARVIGVIKGSAAEAAHLRIGDVILQIDGNAVEDDCHLIYLISFLKVGRPTPLLVFRDGKTLTISATLGVRDESAASE